MSTPEVAFLRSSQTAALGELDRGRVALQVHAEQVRLLYRFAPVGLLASLLVLFVLGGILWQELSRPALFGWFIAAFLITIANYGLYKTFVNLKPGDEQLESWEWRFLAGTVSMAAAWAVMGTYLLPVAMVSRLSVVMLVCLLVTGAVAYYAPHRFAFRLLAFVALVPMAITLAISGERTQQLLSGAVLILAGLLPIIHAKVCRGLADALCAQYDKVLISERLQEEKSRAQKANVALAEEIVSRLKAEQKQLIAAQKLAMHVERTPLGVIELDRALQITEWNPAAAAIFGHEAGDAIGKPLAALIIPEGGREAFAQAWAEVEESAEGGQGTYACVTRTGRTIHGEFHFAPLTDGEGKVLAFACLVQDVTERLNTERTIHYMAHHDALTGLPNRRLMQDRLNQAIMQARRKQRYVAVLFLDLDRFKLVNDTLGHDAGDYMLKEVAARLQRAVRSGDTVARDGGDEFIVILPELERPEHASTVADKIMKELAAPIETGGHELHISTSIGISYYPNDATDVQHLLKHADTAMYQAKDAGRNTIRFFTSDLNFLLSKRLEVETRLRRAIDSGEFVLHYQPQVDVVSGRIVGMEALVRWNDPQAGEVYPSDFIYIAEELGLIIQLGEWIFREGCRQQVSWANQGFTDLSLAINLSPRQFMSRKLVPSFLAILQETGADPARIELEVTETMVMRNLEQSIEKIGELRANGLQIAIDDFGVGYSSLAQLSRLGAHSMKIDRSFIINVPDDTSNTAITEAIIAMAKRLKLRVVAEGVESAEQLKFLRMNQCEFYQGFLHSKAMPVAEATALLAADRMAAAA
jgi:diguanylate cyclase (GGDEF)-like protein/PAS domain S-box-containing protein